MGETSFTHPAQRRDNKCGYGIDKVRHVESCMKSAVCVVGGIEERKKERGKLNSLVSFSVMLFHPVLNESNGDETGYDSKEDSLEEE